jgi:hypothetical protein
MRRPGARALIAAGAALTIVSGALLLDDVATRVGSGGPYGFLTPIYPLCVLPGILLAIAAGLLYSRTGPERLAAVLGVIGALASIPLAWAGFWVGFALALVGSLLVALRPDLRPTSSPSDAGSASAAGSATLARQPWVLPVGAMLVMLVAILVACPQTISADLVSTVDLVNDPLAYDLQAADVVGAGGSSISYTVDAVPQSGNCPLGYAYLVNAYTNDSGQPYWYQVGLSYDWGGGDLAASGWALSYEAFAPDGSSIFPTTTPGAGTAAFSGAIDSGDAVTLTLTLGGGSVSFDGTDASTHASASESYPSDGPGPFEGQSPAADPGFFTGVMTECYRSDPTGLGLTSVSFQVNGAGQSESGVFVDEIDFAWGRLPFLPAVELGVEHSPWTTLVLPTPYSFQAYGLTLFYNSTTFVSE